MKKQLIYAITVASVMAISTACGTGHEHTWTDANCTIPKTCSICGLTEGEALGHTWIDATCTSPKICEVCSTTEGEPIAHEYKEANFQFSKRCLTCDLTEGEALENYYDKIGGKINLRLDGQFDFDEVCLQNAKAVTHGKGVFTDYKCFVSDEMHEAKDGYVWQSMICNITFADENAWKYGNRGFGFGLTSYSDADLFDSSIKPFPEEEPVEEKKPEEKKPEEKKQEEKKLEEKKPEEKKPEEKEDKKEEEEVNKDESPLAISTFSMNYDGEVYDDCIIMLQTGRSVNEQWSAKKWQDDNPASMTFYFKIAVRVPENSSDLIAFVYNSTEEAETFEELINGPSYNAFRFPEAKLD